MMRRMLAILALSLGATALGTSSAAAADVSVPRGWAVVGDRTVRYFVYDENLGKVERADLVDSTAESTRAERRNEAVSSAREFGRPRDAVHTENADTIVNPEDQRTSGRNLRTYEITRHDTIKVTVTTTPYTDYKVTNFEQRNITRLRERYKVTTLFSWTDPYTGEELRETKLSDRTSYRDSEGSWEAGSDKAPIGSGTTSSTAREVTKSTFSERLVKTRILPAADLGGAAFNRPQPRNIAVSSDAGKGSRDAASSSRGKSLDLSGAERVRAGGGRKVASEDDLLAAAANSPILYDESGNAAFRLSVADGKLVFTPLDQSGAARADTALGVARGLRPANGGSSGARVQIKTFSTDGKGIVLTGDFRNPYLDGAGKGSAFLTTR